MNNLHLAAAASLVMASEVTRTSSLTDYYGVGNWAGLDGIIVARPDIQIRQIRAELRRSSIRKAAADAGKKAARKRQKKARAITRRTKS